MFYTFNFSKYLESIPLSFNINSFIEIIILVLTCYYIIKHFQHTRIWVLVKGIFVFFIIYFLSDIFSLKIITSIFQSAISFLFIALIMMFQPELRKILEHIGNKSIKEGVKQFFYKEKNKKFSDKTIQDIISAVDTMSKNKTGALILIENDIPLDDYVKTGLSLNSDITSQLIINVFEKNTPLHDGAMIIKNNKILAATCYLPLSENTDIDKGLGTRHRAAIGASEQSDSFVIVVSEETGAISYVYNGVISHNISIQDLTNKIQSINIEKNAVDVIPNSNPQKIKRIAFSTILGFVSFIVFSYIYNPVITKRITNIPVKVLNESVVLDLNKVYEIEGSQTVSFYVTGTKDVIDSISESDFYASIDLSKLSITNTAAINVSTDKNVDIDTKNAVINVLIEDASEAEINIELQKQGTEKKGFFVYNLSTDTPVIKISGAKSLIKIIDKAVATVNATNKDENFESISSIVLYDKNGNIINKNEYNASLEEINVTAQVYNTKTVPLEINVFDSSQEATLEVNDIKLSKENINIAATDEILNGIESIKIDIDVTNSNTNTINSIIDLNNYLPSNVYLAGDKSLEYTININKLVSKEVIVPANAIEVLNGNGTVLSNRVVVDLTYDKNKINEIDVYSFNPYIDIADLPPGKYSLPLQFAIVDDVSINNMVNVEIEIFAEEN